MRAACEDALPITMPLQPSCWISYRYVYLSVVGTPHSMFLTGSPAVTSTQAPRILHSDLPGRFSFQDANLSGWCTWPDPMAQRMSPSSIHHRFRSFTTSSILYWAAKTESVWCLWDPDTRKSSPLPDTIKLLCINQSFFWYSCSWFSWRFLWI